MPDERCKIHGLKRGEDYVGVCCVFYCHDGQGSFLLHKRSDKCRDEHGRWDCGGGSMEHGESFEEAVRREIKEEYCVEPNKIDLVCVENVLRDNNGTPTHWIAAIHLVEVDPKKVSNGDPEKIDELGWFKLDQFPEPLHSAIPPRFNKIKEHLDKKERPRLS